MESEENLHLHHKDICHAFLISLPINHKTIHHIHTAPYLKRKPDIAVPGNGMVQLVGMPFVQVILFNPRLDGNLCPVIV